MEQNAGLGVDRHVDIGPAVVIEIVGDGGDGVARPRLQDARLLRNIGESSIAVVVVEDVHSARQAARAAHRGNAFPLAIAGLPRHRHLLKVQFDVVAHEQVKESVAVVINPGAAGAPADAVFPQARLLGHIRKRAVAVVVPQHVMTPIAAEQVIPAVIVIVAHANARAPSGAAQAGFFRHVRERAVAVVLKEVLRGRLAIGIGFFARQAVAVGEVDVEPAILVVIEKGQPAALGFNNVFLVLDAAPHVGDVEAGLFRHIHESDGGGRFRMRCGGRLKHGSSCPSPQGRGESIKNS